MAEPKNVFIPTDGSVPVPIEGTASGNNVTPVDGSAVIAVPGTRVTPANKATYIGDYPWLDHYVADV